MIVIEEVEEHETLQLTEGEVTTVAIGGTSLIIILVVCAVLITCCFSVGVALICMYKIKKTAKELKDVKEFHSKS